MTAASFFTLFLFMPMRKAALVTSGFFFMTILCAPLTAKTPFAQNTLPALTDLNEDLQKGKYLTELANCYFCHTGDKEQPFAGGRKLVTPLGTIHTPNITPDPETGIGGWTDEEFYRALHEGIGKNGQHLYPVMPYDSFTKLSYDDVMLIKEWLMAQPAIKKQNIPHELDTPYNYRQLVWAWKKINFKKGEDLKATPEFTPLQRGEYIGTVLAHCSNCHTPRTVTMGTDTIRALTGSIILDHWYAPNITPDEIRGIGRWKDDEIKQFLRTGNIPGKAHAMGPMQEIIDKSLSQLTDDDLEALRLWLRSIPFDGRITSGNTQSRAEWGRRQDYSLTIDPPLEEGQKRLSTPVEIYYTLCANCHGMSGAGNRETDIPNLARNTTLGMSVPNNVIKIILEGSHTQTNKTAVSMPSFKDQLNDEQIAGLTNWLFQHYGRSMTQTNADNVHSLRVNTPVGDAPITGLLKASGIALVALGVIFVLGWVIRLSPRAKAKINALKRRYKRST